MLPFNPIPVLAVGSYLLEPLRSTDFEALYAVAADPEVWAQHPNKNRYERAVFQNFFDGAIKSGSAFKIIDSHTDTIIGSTRIYDYSPVDSSIYIGYTFIAKSYWSKGANPMIKRMMLDFLFQYVDVVLFHIGVDNVRSQISIERIGATKVDRIKVAYFGESETENFVYEVRKENWR